MGHPNGEARATGLWVKRRPPVERQVRFGGSAWVLLVAYRAGGNEYAARLPLSSDKVSFQIDRLLKAVAAGNRDAACTLFACLHEEWGRSGLVGRHLAWEAVFRYLAPLAARATAEA